jgi:hypothetical protein
MNLRPWRQEVRKESPFEIARRHRPDAVIGEGDHQLAIGNDQEIGRPFRHLPELRGKVSVQTVGESCATAADAAFVGALHDFLNRRNRLDLGTHSR